MLKSVYELPNGCYHSMEQNDYVYRPNVRLVFAIAWAIL